MTRQTIGLCSNKDQFMIEAASLKIISLPTINFNPKSSIELKILPGGLMKSLKSNDLSGLTLTIENHL